MNKPHPSLPCLLAVAVGAFPAHAAWQTERSLASPDGSLVLTLERDDASGAFAWSVARGGQPVVTRGALGIDLTDIGTLAGAGAVSHVETRAVDKEWSLPYGERATVPDHFNEETVTLSHPDHGALTVRLQFRAYDEGVTLRYLIDGTGTFTISGEKTSFPLPESSVAWVSGTAQGTIARVAIGSMGNGMERPLTAEHSRSSSTTCCRSINSGAWPASSSASSTSAPNSGRNGCTTRSPNAPRTKSWSMFTTNTA